MRLAKEEVAKRIASSTNKGATSKKKDEPTESSTSNDTTKTNEEVFKVGDFCRATYEEDGVDYEAKIIENDPITNKFVIKYIGYENEEIKNGLSLLPSWGKKFRKQQKSEAKAAKGESGSVVSMDADVGQVLFDRNKAADSKQLKDKAQKVPCGYPIGNNIMFPPPPPMPPMLNDNLEDAEHLSAMLMSWYMSGYYTGLYQGQKLAEQKRSQQ